MSGGPLPDIWTPVQFKNETNPNKARKKFVTIDNLLGRWDMIKAEGVTGRSGRITLLNQLVAACSSYVTSQTKKETGKEQSRFTSPSDRLKNRIAKTKVLTGQAFARLAHEQYAHSKAMAALPSQAKTLNRTGTRALQGGYANERTLFEATKASQHLSGQTGQQGVINPLGGSFAHSAHGKAAGDTMPAHIQAIGRANFATLDVHSYNALHQHFSGATFASGDEARVHFARKDERISNLMMVPMGGKLYGSDAGLYGENKWDAWAMDRHGNLFVKRIQGVVVDEADHTGNKLPAQYNHSSFCAGREVICAGLIKINKGDITYISNESGHYTPPPTQLANAIMILAEEYDLPVGVTITEIEINGGVRFDNLIGFLAAHPPV